MNKILFVFFILFSFSTIPSITWALPECTSSGYYHNCFGTYIWDNGDKYVGEWKDDKQHGQGTLTYADGNKYVGEYKDHKRHGQGTFTFADGRKEIGSWENDLLNGYATRYNDVGTILQEGIFKDDVFQYAQKKESGDFNRGLTAYNKGDYATALKEWKILAEQGHPRAQYNLGQMYRRGDGVPQDYKEAVRWYKLAADQGHAKALYNLGLMYDEGEGVPEDDKEAVRWYKLAAEQGQAKAQYNLGLMYALGKGVPQDRVYAHMWWNIAALTGDDSAKKNKKIVEKKMTSSQIEEAQRLARECVKKNYKGC